MKHFEVNNQKYLAVDMPENAKSPFSIEYASDGGMLIYNINETLDNYIDLPEGRWDIVGLAGDWSTWQSGIIDKGKEWNMVHNAECIKQRYNLSDNHLILKQL